MDVIRFAIDNPVKVAVGVILTLMAGLIAFQAIPIQLTPDVDQPVITVETRWDQGSPEEVEQEIIDEQEEKLQGVTGLKSLTATASDGSGNIEMEFEVGTDMSRALQEVSDSLREVPAYPDEADEPVITLADTAVSSPMSWCIIDSTDPDVNVPEFFDAIDRRVKPLLEQVNGVGQVDIYGGRERQVHVQVDPILLAQRAVTFNALIDALRGENLNTSAGDLAEGRMDVRVRTVGQYTSLQQILDTVIRYDEAGPVRVSDVATVELTLEETRSFVRLKGKPAMAFRVVREPGANVMEVMADVRDVIRHINQVELPLIHETLEVRVAYQETEYIDQAIINVQTSLIYGAILAVIVLLVFLRTIRPTLIVGLAIPISVIGTFVVMTALGRNLNVISLAGLAFAVGMVVDAAIVVLENIDRHIGMGKRPFKAAYDGAREVWGAILASTLTTLVVFIPVVFMELEAGQLFRDIALAVMASVTLSLIVSVTVIPMASARLLVNKPHGKLWHAVHSLGGLTMVLSYVNRLWSELVYGLSERSFPRIVARVVIISLFTVASLGGAYWLMPPTNYLPNGNQNLVFGIMLNPPGYSIDKSTEIAEFVEERVGPYWRISSQEESDAQTEQVPVLAPFTFEPVTNIPPIDEFFLVRIPSGTMFMGARSQVDDNVAPLADLISSAMSAYPGSIGFASQRGLFGRDLGGANAISVEVVSNDIAAARAAGNAIKLALYQNPNYGPPAVEPRPLNFDVAGPEMRVQMKKLRAGELNIDSTEAGVGIQSLVDGTVVGDYRLDGENIDLMMILKPGFEITPEAIKEVPLAVQDRDGSTKIIPFDSIAEMSRVESPQEIRRLERQRAVELVVTPPANVPLEASLDEINGMIAGLRESGQIAPGVLVRLAGSADALSEVQEAMVGHWAGLSWETVFSMGMSRLVLALIVVYLLMAALFESFLYPLVIMFSVPLATIGGFIGLALMHWYDPAQQLDVLTMLGFVILIGIVVNNAILIVHQALNFMRGFGESEADVREKLSSREAIRESVRSRIRPIFMTTLTSVCGMFPLVLASGSGSELYKGLGSVMIGGLICSTVFTLLVVPLVFSLTLDIKAGVVRLLGWEAVEGVDGMEEEVVVGSVARGVGK